MKKRQAGRNRNKKVRETGSMEEKEMKNMKKGTGVLSLIIVVLVIVALGFVSIVGVGKNKSGSAADIKLGLDLAGGVSITYEAVGENPTEENMKDTIYKLQKRVEDRSTEAAVYQEGENRINVDIPGEDDADEVLKALGKAGSIEFVDPDGEVVVDGSDIETASAETRTDGATSYVVSLKLNANGTQKFAEATARLVGQPISIVYDGQEIQAPTVNEPINNGQAEISGQKTFQDAEELASVIRIGALPLELKEIRSTVVGAKLGAEAIDTSLLAGLIGFILVIVFMIAVYRIPGIASSLALCFYVTVMILVLIAFDVTLTLPGIAGILLSIGMAVDANVIIFTRIKEELATGKTVRSAIKLGFDKALSAIIDGNVTTLIAAAVLWFKGSGTVKGFAQTLAIGIVLSMVTALFVTKFILKCFYAVGCDKEKFYGIKKEGKTIDFIGKRAIFFVISGVMAAACVVMLVVNKNSIGGILNYGLDFKGGTSLTVTFNEDTAKIKGDVEKLVESAVGQKPEISEVRDTNQMIIKTVELDEDTRAEVKNQMIEKYGITEAIEEETISGSVSDEMRTDAIIAVVIAGICMLIYIWIRFKDITFGASAVLALVHDVILVLLVYAAARISVGNTFIACMLTIVGYSINATIVIFDRIRENKALMGKKDTLADCVNKSITQTLSRSINTSLTTMFMVVVLAIIGVESIRGFAVPLLAGIICGAYSSVCVTGTLWYTIKSGVSKKK